MSGDNLRRKMERGVEDWKDIDALLMQVTKVVEDRFRSFVEGRTGAITTPIINWPEVAILGIHKIEKRPVVRNDQVVIRAIMYLSCSFHYRVIDGHVGAAFVQSGRNFLEHPAMLFVGLE